MQIKYLHIIFLTFLLLACTKENDNFNQTNGSNEISFKYPGKINPTQSHVVEGSNGGHYFLGKQGNGHFITHVHPDGKENWRTLFNFGLNAELSTFDYLNESSFLVAGVRLDTLTLHEISFVQIATRNGDLIPVLDDLNVDSTHITDLLVLNDEFILTGFGYVNDSLTNLLRKFDLSGTLLWNKDTSGEVEKRFKRLFIAPNNQFLIFQESLAEGAGNHAFFMAQETGDIEPTPLFTESFHHHISTVLIHDDIFVLGQDRSNGIKRDYLRIVSTTGNPDQILNSNNFQEERSLNAIAAVSDQEFVVLGNRIENGIQLPLTASLNKASTSGVYDLNFNQTIFSSTAGVALGVFKITPSRYATYYSGNSFFYRIDIDPDGKPL
ncbi:MAG: hypothetical protein N4A41_13720 [Crocinitomicaceae bacterium]|jgi:hypothetical protein|nr:hypothetical protein [Crocinitomicaceae bacterium]